MHIPHALRAAAAEEKPAHYEPDYRSLEKHEVPAWFEDAKLGIFIHWGIYSVPALSPVTGKIVFTTGTVVGAMNTPGNRKLPKAGSRRGKAAFAKLKLVTAVELGLHNPLAARTGSLRLDLAGTFYVGLGLCAHDNAKFERAVFSNVGLRNGPATIEGAKLVSSLEALDLGSLYRKAFR